MCVPLSAGGSLLCSYLSPPLPSPPASQSSCLSVLPPSVLPPLSPPLLSPHPLSLPPPNLPPRSPPASQSSPPSPPASRSSPSQSSRLSVLPFSVLPLSVLPPHSPPLFSPHTLSLAPSQSSCFLVLPPPQHVQPCPSRACSKARGVSQPLCPSPSASVPTAKGHVSAGLLGSASVV